MENDSFKMEDPIYKYLKGYEAQINTKLDVIANHLKEYGFPLELAQGIIAPTIAELCMMHFEYGVDYTLSKIGSEEE